MNNQLKNDDLRSILIVESIDDEIRDFADIMKSSRVEVYTFKNSIEAILWLQTNTVDIIVLEDSLGPMNLPATREYLQNELKLNIPVFISTYEIGKEQDHMQIQKPFRTESLQVLSKVENESNEHVPSYSLDYLKEVSENNDEFIVSFLEVFITSVRDQLVKLENAYDKQDFKQIGTIAHNIKPSFEMLLIKEAANICDDLTYDFSYDALPAQIARLQAIFKNIKAQLESDFTLKNQEDGEDISN